MGRYLYWFRLVVFVPLHTSSAILHSIENDGFKCGSSTKMNRVYDHGWLPSPLPFVDCAVAVATAAPREGLKARS